MATGSEMLKNDRVYRLLCLALTAMLCLAIPNPVLAQKSASKAEDVKSAERNDSADPFDFPARRVIEAASAQNGNVARYETDKEYAERLSQLWLTKAFGPQIAHHGFKDPELAKQWRAYFDGNRLALVNLMKEFRQIAGLEPGADPSAKFPTDDQLKQLHRKVLFFVEDQEALNQESERLGTARREYCVTQGIPCLSANYVAQMITDVPVEDEADAILAKNYFTSLYPETLQVTIAKLELDYGPQNAELETAWAELVDASETYQRAVRFLKDADKELKQASKAYWQEIEAPSKSLKELEDRLAFEIFQAQRHYGKREGFEQTRTFTDAQTRINRQNARIKTIEARLTALNDQPPSDFLHKSATELQNERDRRHADIVEVEGEIARLRAIYEKPPETPGTKQAKQALDTQGPRLLQRLQNATERLEPIAENRLRLKQEHDEAEERYARAVKAYRDLLEGRAQLLFSIKRVNTYEAIKVDHTAELAELNDKITTARKRLKRLQNDKTHERNFQNAAFKKVQKAEDNLVNGIYFSVGAQVATEAGSQTVDLFLAGLKQGPGAGLKGTIVQGITSIVDNILNPKQIYEPLIRQKEKSSIIGEMARGYVPSKNNPRSGWDWAETFTKFAANETVKFSGGLAQDQLAAQSLKSSKVKEGVAKWLFDKMFGTDSERAKAAQDGINNRTLQNGKTGLAKATTTQVLVGQAKSLAIEAIKRELAEHFEGKAFKKYLDQENKLARSVRRMKNIVNEIFKIEDQLAEWVAKRDELAQFEFDEKSGFSIKKNEAFELDAGVQFELIFKNNDEAQQIAISAYPQTLKLSLNNVELERKAGQNVFVLNEQAAEQLRVQEDETLKLKIVFGR